MIEFKMAPVEVTLTITHPKGRGWAEAVQKAFASRKSMAPRASTLEAAGQLFVGWAKYLPVTEVAAELAVSGWTVQIRDSYTFSAEKGGDRISAETKARWVEVNGVKENQNCWSFSYSRSETSEPTLTRKVVRDKVSDHGQRVRYALVGKDFAVTLKVRYPSALEARALGRTVEGQSLDYHDFRGSGGMPSDGRCEWNPTGGGCHHDGSGLGAEDIVTKHGVDTEGMWRALEKYYHEERGA
jgi:hypothetical protein